MSEAQTDQYKSAYPRGIVSSDTYDILSDKTAGSHRPSWVKKTLSKVAQATADSDLPIITVGNSKYKGQPPQFAQIRVNPEDPNSPLTWIRTMKGIPFVNVA
jgi:hypothetical protein